MRTVTLLIVLLTSFSAFAQGVKTEGWLEDLAQLRREMSGHYANLEWAVSERGVDLMKLSAETEAKIREARTDAEAKLAIQAFLQSFGDGHLRVDWANAASTPAAASAKLCDRLGFRGRPVRPGVDFSALTVFRPIEAEESRYIPAGSLTLASGRRIGVVRIGLFMEEVFPGLCEAALAELKLTQESVCDDQCEDRVRRKSSNLYSDALAAQVERLNREKVDALVVDITGNGGGNDVYQPMARMLTSRPMRTTGGGFVRHPHWIKQHSDRVKDLESELVSAPRAIRKHVVQGLEAVRRDLAEAERQCDLSPLWENKKAGCSIVVPFDKGGIAYAKSGELSNTNIGSIFFGASRYQYKEGVWSGPLIVLIDGRTASSSEAFASMLGDNGAAMIVGQPSLGAGCGYTNGGIQTILKHSGGHVKMPDCVRFRSDGSNEINGIDPDFTVHWRGNDSPFQRANRTVKLFQTIVK